MNGRRVLLVDDQPHLIRILKRSLEKSGYYTEMASNGLVAMERLRDTEFDIVVTDYQMPKMDGITLCESIESELTDRVIHKVLVTAVADTAICDWAEKLPNTSYLEKPVSMKMLGDKLNEVFATANGTTGL